MRARCWLAAGAWLVATTNAPAQVGPEPSLVTADLYGANVAQASLAVPKNQVLLGGMLRFPLFDDLDLGARAGVGFVDGGNDYVYVGGDARYGLIGQRLTGVGPSFNLTFHSGAGVQSASGLTRWKIPIGFPTGLTFPLVKGSLEIFTHPRLELGFQNLSEKSDAALTIDLGGYWLAGPVLGILADVRFGSGIFDEPDAGVFAVGVTARF